MSLNHKLDRIHIREIALRCIVGIYPDERINKQDVVISVCLHADLTQACTTDTIEVTVDYKTVKKNIVALVEDSSFYLIEALAESVAQVCLKDEKVSRVDVTVEKPGALRFARTVEVEITRTRANS